MLIPAYLEHLAIGERVAGVPKRQLVILPKLPIGALSVTFIVYNAQSPLTLRN